MARTTKKTTGTKSPAEKTPEIDADAVAPEAEASDASSIEDAAHAAGPETLPAEPIEDALVVGETPPADEALPDEVLPEDTVIADAPPEDGVEIDPAADPIAMTDVSAADETATDATLPSEHETPASDTAILPAPPPQIIEKRGPGFVPLVLSGLVAGAIGYFVATMASPDVAVAPVDDARIEAVEAELAALRDTPPTAPDLTEIEAAQADLSARIDALEAGGAVPAPAGPATGASTAGLDDDALATLRADLDALAARVDAGSDGAAPQGADMAALSDRVDGLSERIDGIDIGPLTARLDDLDAAVTDLQARAESGADDAQAVAQAAARDRLALALRTGEPYADALAELPDAPEALAAQAETGVPTSESLARDFPPLARAALREARAGETADGGIGSLAGRFLNARSLEPREGDDADAVLSRAEAAARDGDIDAALAEVQTLPEAARAPLADWIERARTRATAEAALNDYLQDG